MSFDLRKFIHPLAGGSWYYLTVHWARTCVEPQHEPNQKFSGDELKVHALYHGALLEHSRDDECSVVAAKSLGRIDLATPRPSLSSFPF